MILWVAAPWILSPTILFVLYTRIGWEDLPQGARVRLRDDVLAAVTGLADRQGVRSLASGAAGRAERGGSDRLVPGVRGCVQGSARRGRRHRAQHGRPGQGRLQTPPDL